MNERGSMVVESVFGIVVLLTIALAVIQVALFLYARNVIAAAAHDAVRRAVELDASRENIGKVAIDAIRRSVGGLVDDVDVDVATVGGRVAVRVRGDVTLVGPLPLEVEVVQQASAELFDAP